MNFGNTGAMLQILLDRASALMAVLKFSSRRRIKCIYMCDSFTKEAGLEAVLSLTLSKEGPWSLQLTVP